MRSCWRRGRGWGREGEREPSLTKTALVVTPASGPHIIATETGRRGGGTKRIRSEMEVVMANWDSCPAVERHPLRVSGAWVFKGTRVPVAALFENLKAGASIDEFLEWFQGVERWKVETVLDHELRALGEVATR